MARHVTDDALLDLLEGAGDREGLSHLDTCGECAGRLEEARQGRFLAEGADLPEPSPLYWGAFRRNVARRIETEGRDRSRRFAWGAVVASAAAVLVAVTLRTAPPPPAAPASVLPAWSALPPADQDEGLAVLEGLAEADDGLAVLTGERLVADSLAEFSDEDNQAIADALRREEGAL